MTLPHTNPPFAFFRGAYVNTGPSCKNICAGECKQLRHLHRTTEFITSAVCPGYTDSNRTGLCSPSRILQKRKELYSNTSAKIECHINSDLRDDKQIGMYDTGRFVRDKLLRSTTAQR